MKTKQFFQTETPHLFAHRGGSLAGKENENTLAAFRSAADNGCKYLETDVLLTRDNQVITYHGSRTKKEAKKTGLLTRKKIRSLSLKELNALRGKNEPTPLLEDVISAFPTMRISIDAKTDEVVTALVQIIERTNSVGRVCIASFRLKRLLRAAQLFEGVDSVALAYCLHPRFKGLVRAFPGFFLGGLRAKGVDCIHIHHKTVDSRIVEVAHGHGILVYAWTVNTKADFERCIEVGVDGIISDETELLSINTM